MRKGDDGKKEKETERGDPLAVLPHLLRPLPSPPPISPPSTLLQQARTWYIAKPMPADYFSGRVSHKEARDHHLNKPVSAVPPFQYPTEAAKAEGDARYAKQKAERSEKESIPVREIKDGKATLIHILLPSGT